MPKASIEIDFRVQLPRGRWMWTDEPMGVGARGDDHGVDLPPPLLIREPVPLALGATTRVVDRSGVRLYDSFRTLAKHTVAPEHATFADAVVRFATQYGFLGEPVMLYHVQPESSALPDRPAQAESLQFWGHEVQCFYELDRLATLLQVGLRAGGTDTLRKLRKRIFWDRELGEIRYFHPTMSYIDFIRPETRRIDPDAISWTNKVIAARDRHPVRYERLLSHPRTEDVVWTYLSLELNTRIGNALEVFFPPDRKRIAVAHPRTLLDALYLRLYHKAAGIEWERHCKECGDPLPPGTTVRRAFCGNTCRTRWHRRISG
jgi:hypothetical protein